MSEFPFQFHTGSELAVGEVESLVQFYSPVGEGRSASASILSHLAAAVVMQ